MKLLQIRIRGGKYNRFDSAKGDGALFLGGQLHLQREPENEFDSNAIAAYVRHGEEAYKIGHVSAKEAAWLAPRFDKGAVVHLCTITKIDDKHKGVDAQLDLRGGWGPRPAEGSKEPTSVPEDDIPF